MSNAPYLLKDARTGYRFGDGTLIDAMIHDGLWDQYFPMTMATQGSIVANELGMTREEQDRFAYESHRRARRAHAAGNFADEIVPVRVATKARDKIVVERFRSAQVRVPRSAVPFDKLRVTRGMFGITNLRSSLPSTMRAGRRSSPAMCPHAVVDRDEAVRGDASLEAMAKLRPLERRWNRDGRPTRRA